MSSRVTAVRSSQPRIGVGTADNMIDLLLRAPYTYHKKRRGQRGSGLVSDLKRDVGRSLKRGLNTKSLAVVKRGVKRAAANAIYNELDRQATQQLKGLTGIKGKIAKRLYPKMKRKVKKKLDDVFGVGGFMPEETIIPPRSILGPLPGGFVPRIPAEYML